MKPIDWILIFFCLLIGTLGVWLGRFLGGCLAGSTFLFALLLWVGKRQAARAGRNMDKGIRDLIVHRQKQNDGDETIED